ncbi:hypothetical protein A3K73_04320 [Candidatus Pacearchaeota archaeon RBG_13_36_9]|nr:MAG: hypothetical protein A3K73_04320 [Candidatus Pacearchaeota archaeon RBG_13_36_9]
MQNKSILEIEREYELETDRIIKAIKKEKAKKVLLQFPDGLKPYSAAIAEEIEKNSNAEIMIWMGTCFGACDVPLDVERLGVDLIVQFGHSPWKYKGKDVRVL